MKTVAQPRSIRFVSAVVENRADLGIALDGDADRLVMVDAEGQVYNGDQLLYLIAKDRLAYSDVKGVVGTLMTNMGLEVSFPGKTGRFCASECRRPLRSGNPAGKRVVIGRRGIGPSDLSRQAYNG